MVGGHFPLSFYRRNLNLSDYFCVTTFRDPVKRVQSRYDYAVRNPDHSEHRVISKLSLQEFVERQPNPVTRLLSDGDDPRAAFDVVRDVFDRWVLSENIDVLTADLHRRGGQPLQAAPHLNVGHRAGYHSELDSDVLASIRQHHASDLELYRLLADSYSGLTSFHASARSTATRPSDSGTDPTFYVVTPTYNAAAFLDEAIHSVVSQAGNFSIRYHVQDGGSSDQSMEIVQRWQAALDAGQITIRCRQVTLTAEACPDEGMYDAIARGFEHLAVSASGIMTWINGDDRLAPGAMANVADALRDLPDVQFLGGRPSIIDVEGRTLGAGDLVVFTRDCLVAGLHDGRHLPFVMQEGTFWRTGLWQQAGGVDRRFRLAGDWDLWRRFSGEANYVTLDTVTGYHRRRPGQLSEDMAAYLGEVDAALSGPGSEAYEITLSRYMRELACDDAKTDGLRAFAARRNDAGRWVLVEERPPAPHREKLAPVDGDWIARAGFDKREGPFPEIGITTAFYWTTARHATIELFSAHAGRRTIIIGLRGMVRQQKVKIGFPGQAKTGRRLRGRPSDIETLEIVHDFAVGPCRLELEVSRLIRSSEGRTLGVMVISVRFATLSERRKRWIGFLAGWNRTPTQTSKESEHTAS